MLVDTDVLIWVLRGNLKAAAALNSPGDLSLSAVSYMEEYVLTFGLDLADALIAATAVEHSKAIHTGNDKHYRCIPGLELSVFRL